MATRTLVKDSATPRATPLAAKAKTSSRLLYLDNLRILLTALVILLHLAIGYGAAGDWYYDENGPITLVSTILLTMFTVINQAFFMGFFFMIASYLTPASYERKGASRYVVERLKRLGIPILFYALVINPLLVYALRVFHGNAGALWDSPRFAFGPMWFVETLLILSLAFVVWRGVTGTSANQTTPVAAAAPSNLAIALFALALGLVTFVDRIAFPVGWWFEPLHLQLAHFPQYIALFVMGIVAFSRNWFEALTVQQGRAWSWVVLALIPLFPVVAIAGGALEGDAGLVAFMGGLHWQSFVYSIWEQLLCVAMIITLLTWFRERLARQGNLARTLSADAYAVFIVHPPVIVLLAMALSGIPIEMGLKFVLVAPLAVALSFVVGHVVRQLPVARDIL